MKWIEYDYVCNENTGATLHKKVEYNEGNLAVAAREACDGNYSVTEDDTVYDPKPLPVALGGTGACTAADALTNLGGLPVILIEGKHYGSSFPSGVKGRIFFKKVGS